MANKTEQKRGFIHLSKSWYGKSVLATAPHVDQITIGLYGDQGLIGGEIQITWHQLAQSVSPRLECFDDAWENLTFFDGLLKAMATADNKSISPLAFRELLLCCGFDDMTPTAADCVVAP